MVVTRIWRAVSCGIVMLLSASLALADGFETLGPPSIPIAPGSGFAAGGVGLNAGDGDITVDVPAGAAVAQVLLYWTGENFLPDPGNGDDTINVNPARSDSARADDGPPAIGMPMPVGPVPLQAMAEVTGILIGSTELSQTRVSAYRADITAMNLIGPGANTVSVSGLTFDALNQGAGIVVIFDDGSSLETELRDGLDHAFINNVFPLESTVLQQFDFDPAPASRTATLTMFYDDGEAGRADEIEIIVDGNLTLLTDLIDSSDGDRWDTIVVDVPVPAGATSLSVQAFSRGGRFPDSLDWIVVAFQVPPVALPPDIDIEKLTNGVDADDPNAGDAPQIMPGNLVSWSYVVTNTGQATLFNVTVTDDQGVSVACPQDTLTPGESMVCTASGLAENLLETGFTTVPGLCGTFPDTPLYENMGTATGESGVGEFVQDVDPSHYCNPQAPAINIEKRTNGVDADDPNAGDAPQIMPGNLVNWSYIVTNTGNTTLVNVAVSDDQGVAVSCPLDTLNPGQSMICTASGLADDLLTTGFTTVPGLCGGFPDTPLYENMGTATGNGPSGTFVQAVDPSHYCNPQEPSIDIEKLTNDVDADDPNAGDAPQIMPGNLVNWSYIVTNTGNTTLFNVAVADDQGVAVSCPQDTLAPGESMTCTASGPADDLLSTGFTTVPGLCGGFPDTPLYENMGTASGTSGAGDFVQAVDPSHYCNPQAPSIDIEKLTNDVDADDPNAGDAPQIMPGNLVSWSYLVTNTGNTTLFNVSVDDDQGVAVSCPQDTLAPGESMTCTASGLADDLLSTGFTTVPGLCGGFPETPLYENQGTASGESANGEFVQAADPSHYCNPPQPSITIEKATNGVDADDPNAGDAPQIMPGNLVTWTYLVTNTGNTTLDDVSVNDDQGVAVSCPQDTLAPGESMTCTASGLAENLLDTTFTTVPGLCGGLPNVPLYENMGTATGQSTDGEFVQAVDPSHYCNPQQPGIEIEKLTNDVDADDPNAGDAPQIMPGNLVNWSYIVTNTGNTTLVNVGVTDDQGVAVSCPQDTLAPGESMTCTASGLADNLLDTTFTTVPGLCGGFPDTPLYENMGTATGETTGGDFVQAVDPSHYCNPQQPDIDIEKLTNDVDADDPNAGDAPQIMPGNLVSWSYIVTNTGNTTLSNVTVTDDQGVAVSCPQDTLVPGESMTCTASGPADDLLSTSFTTVPGLCGSFPDTPLYENRGSATGEGPGGEFVQDVDPSHYCNPQEPGIDIEKLTNGVDADDPNAGDAPTIVAGGTVTWSYLVTNTGNTTLNDVVVTDDQGVAVSCPQDTLTPGESMTCTASGTADDLLDTDFTTVPGLCAGFPGVPLYENRGTASGESTAGDLVEDEDLSHYCNPPKPKIDLEKLTNGIDADDPNAGDAPPIMPGDLVTWSYIVTNQGNVTVTGITVIDDQGVSVVCPQDTLAPGESMICTASGIADDLLTTGFTTVPGLCAGFPNTPLYENRAIATGTTEIGVPVEDQDLSHYCNPQTPAIRIEKSTNGVDADDANAGDAPQLAPGDPVNWTYLVTNIGNVALFNVTVFDNQGVAVDCPRESLAPGESMICTGDGIADDLDTTGFDTEPGVCAGVPDQPLYKNIGLTTGTSITGMLVQDIDPSHYCNPPLPGISIEKMTNNVDADDPNAGDAPQIEPGDIVVWTYLVTNTGDITLTNVGVVDDQGVEVVCPQDTLAAGETMTCTASALADDLSDTGFTVVPGLCGAYPDTPLYENMGTASGQSVTGDFVEAVDPSHYCNPQRPNIDIEKATNGVDADDPSAGDAPQILPGDVVSWTYLVTNTGNVTLSNVSVGDDQGVAVSCPQDTLAPGESMTCTASANADDLLTTAFTTVPGLCGIIPGTPLYENMGTATGMSDMGEIVEDVDPSHYCNPQTPSIDIEKATNGVDADDPAAGDAPQVMAGNLVSWTYVVTNTGNVPLSNVSVVDDQGVPVSCPQDTLDPGESIICTASGLADNLLDTPFTTVPGLCGGFPATPLYENLGRASGETVIGQFVQDEDPSHYCNPQEPGIVIEKATNNVDADDPASGDAPQIAPGDIVVWTYVVTNTGNVALANISVTDDQGVAVSCPADTLNPGESFTCTASAFAEDLANTSATTVPGLCGEFPNTPLYENFGLVSGETAAGDFVQDDDPSHYCNPQEPSIDIEKATNGVDADDPNAGDAPQIMAGDVVTWSYVVTNTGNVPLSNVVVVDDQGVAVSCPQDTLAAGDSFICTASGLAENLEDTTFTTVPGQCGELSDIPLYENMGSVTGEGPSGEIVEDVDPSHYCNPQLPDIDIEKATNGVDADDPNAGDAPQIGVGNLVSWTYLVTNTGNLTLFDVVVNDDQGVTVTCPQDTLAPAESMICTASAFADDLLATSFTTVPGLCGGFPQTPLYENMGVASGQTAAGAFVQDDDPSHYCNPQTPAIDIEKATNGEDADDPNAGDAPQIAVGNLVSWSYVVTNIGNVPLVNVTITDDQGVAVTCPQDTLAVGESIVCTASAPADDLLNTAFTTVPGLCGGFPQTPLYENKGRATGDTLTGVFVEDIDPSHYCNPQSPDLRIEKLTNGVDADDPNAGDAPQIAPGDLVSWSYIVTNTGNVPLANVSVLDDQGVAVSCPQDTLLPGETIVCTASGPADDLLDTLFTTVPGLCGGIPNTPLYENMGTASGETSTGDIVLATDPSHYCNPERCSLEVGKTCLIPMPPATGYECTKPIDTLTMIWDGAQPVRIKAWKGDVGSTLLADIDDIQPGEEVSVMGFAGSPNDVYWEVFQAGTDTKIGESTFHLSCSDDEMDGPEDCGNNEGNGKGNDSGLINDWLLEGIVDAGGTLDCTTTPPGPGVSECEFQAFPASCELTGAPDTVTLLYTGGGCAASDNDQGSKTECIETDGGIDDTQAVTVTLWNGDVFDVQPGESFVMPRDGSGTEVTLSNAGGTEFNDIHTSCSAPLAAGDVYGSLTLVGLDGNGIGTDVIYTYTITNTSNVDIVNLSAIDIPLGPVPGTPGSLAAGDSVTLMTSAFLTETTTNTVIVDGDGADGQMCNASAQATVTILPPPPCDVEGEGVLELSGDRLKWNLTNAGASTATVESISITWPADNGDLIEVKLDGDKILDESRSPTSTVIGPADWINDPAKRQIAPGDTATLEIKFDNDVVELQGDYQITVNFEEGCSVTYENTGLPFTCTKPIDSLSMIWDGSQSVRVVAYKGSVGAEVLADVDNVAVGDELTVNGFAGSPNDVFWEIFAAGTSSPIGESKFHLSCSDNNMNGAEDCGNRQGDGKDDDEDLVNDWLLEGMIDADGPFDCSDLP